MLEERVNPFPGLRPFEPDEDYLFFGRERQTDELLRRLRTTRFLSILGTSGSGKSSLVRSGLIPRLYGGGMTAAGSRWRAAIMRPGDDPLGNLAAALALPEALGDQAGEEALTGAFFETTLRASNLGLIECIHQARIRPYDNVLVLIDQFEELFRYKRSRGAAGRDEALAFVKLLLAARETDAPIYIALTMRSDFVGDCMEFGELPQVINDGVYLVSRMTRDELRSAITSPVAVGGATIAPRLVSRLLNDVGDDPDQLPILQHALMRTWDAWAADHEAGEPLDLRHYEAIGTMRAALSRHAEEAFAELREDERPIAQKMFKALTDKDTDVRGVRRPTSLGELRALTGAGAAAVVAVVDRFRHRGRTFLMPPAGVPLRDESIIDISHESLMRVWTRLWHWADEESRSAQLYVRLAHAAALHEQGVAALWRDPELQLALAWRATEKPTETWAARYDPSFARAMAFLEASRRERDRDARERERRRRALIAILVTATVIVTAFGVYAWRQKKEAEASAQVADLARKRAVDALTQVRIAVGQAKEQTRIAEIQKVNAQSAKRDADAQRVNSEKQTVLAKQQTTLAQEQTKAANVARQDATNAQNIADTNYKTAVEQKKNADDARIAAERLARREEAHALALKIVQNRSVYSRPNPDDALLAERLNRENGGRADDPDIFNAMLLTLFDNTPRHLWTGSDVFRSLVIAPDSRAVFAGGDDGSLFTFDLTKDDPAEKIGMFPGGVRALAVRGNVLAVGTAKGRVFLRDLRDPAKNVRELDAGTDVVSTLAFQPNGRLLAAGSFDGSVRLWNVDDLASPPVISKPLEAASVRVQSLAFSADGASLAAGTSRGAYLFRVSTSKWDEIDCGNNVRSVAISPGGTVACGMSDGAIDAGGFFHGHTGPVNSLVFNAPGDAFLSASSDGTVRLWDARRADLPPIVLSGHQSWVWAAIFASNGDRILSAGKEIRLWPANTKVLADELCAYLRQQGSDCGAKR
jgi:energy-coupling factor transporter ATP-binding protein EcfA2